MCTKNGSYCEMEKKSGGGGGGGVGLGGQGGCEWRSEAFVKVKKTKTILGGGVGSGGGGVRVGGVRVDVYGEVKLL